MVDMKNISILFLKAALVLLILPTLALGSYGLYYLLNNPANPDYASSLYPIIAGMYVSLIPLYHGVYRIWRILSHVRKETIESTAAARDIKAVRLSAVLFGAVFLLISPFVFMVAQLDDAPGLVLFGMIPVFLASIILAIFTLFQEMLKVKAKS